MNEIEILINELAKFRDDHNWSQFHNPKDLALALSIEAAELNELFLWATTVESELVDWNKIRESQGNQFIREDGYAVINRHNHRNLYSVYLKMRLISCIFTT
jgi:hypothetical protein